MRTKNVYVENHAGAEPVEQASSSGQSEDPVKSLEEQSFSLAELPFTGEVNHLPKHVKLRNRDNRQHDAVNFVPLRYSADVIGKAATAAFCCNEGVGCHLVGSRSFPSRVLTFAGPIYSHEKQP